MDHSISFSFVDAVKVVVKLKLPLFAQHYCMHMDG